MDALVDFNSGDLGFSRRHVGCHCAWRIEKRVRMLRAIRRDKKTMGIVRVAFLADRDSGTRA
jgi:hypothetical protein